MSPFVPICPGTTGTSSKQASSLGQTINTLCPYLSLSVPGQQGQTQNRPANTCNTIVNSLSRCPVSPRHITSASWPVLSLSLLSRDRWGQMGTRCVNSLSPCPVSPWHITSISWPVLRIDVPVVPGQMGTWCVDSLSACPVSPRHITSVSWPVFNLPLLSRDRWGQNLFIVVVWVIVRVCSVVLRRTVVGVDVTFR